MENALSLILSSPSGTGHAHWPGKKDRWSLDWEIITEWPKTLFSIFQSRSLAILHILYITRKVEPSSIQ